MDRSYPDLSARRAPEICTQDPSREQDSKSHLMCSTPNVGRTRLEMTDQVEMMACTRLHPSYIRRVSALISRRTQGCISFGHNRALGCIMRRKV